MLFVCYLQCTTCQKARKWLEANGIALDELMEWNKRSGLPLKKFFNSTRTPS